MATQKPMCIITINFDTFAMPADAALKVMQLMQQARTCRFEAMVPTDQGNGLFRGRCTSTFSGKRQAEQPSYACRRNKPSPHP